MVEYTSPLEDNATIVSQSKPTPEVGKLWFEPISGGVNVYASTKQRWDFVTVITNVADNVVDNFETGLYNDRNNTFEDLYTGDTTEFTRQQSTVINGSYSLKGPASNTATHYYVVQAEPINATPVQGDTFRTELDILGLDKGSPGMLFGVQDADNMFELTYRTGEIAIVVVTNGNRNRVATASVSDRTGRHTLEVEWNTDDSITGRLLDSSQSKLAQVTTTDATFTSGGVGFHDYDTKDATVFDNYRIL